MNMFSFPRIRFTICPLLSLGRGAMYLPFPFLSRGKNRLGLGTTRFRFLPASRNGSIVMRQATSINASVRNLTIFDGLFRCLFEAQTTVDSRAISGGLILFGPFGRPLRHILLIRASVYITITILGTSGRITGGHRTETVAGRLLMYELHVVLLDLCRLIIRIGIVPLTLFRLPYKR